MASCPVEYVRKSEVRGTLFGDEDDGEGETVLSCADTGFWVDHKELETALTVLKANGVKWPLGELPEGCEFLVLVEVEMEVRNRMWMEQNYSLMVQGYMGNQWMMGKPLAYGFYQGGF